MTLQLLLLPAWPISKASNLLKRTGDRNTGYSSQRRHPALPAGIANVRLARDCERMVFSIREEVAHADTVDLAKARKGLKSRDHPVCFELGQKRSGVAGFCGEASERKTLLVA